MRIANPEILWRSEELIDRQRGLPVAARALRRCRRGRPTIRLRYLDHENEIREIEAKGLLATCLQHEIDHLDGMLFVDHISALKRGMILRKLAKAKRSRALAAGLSACDAPTPTLPACGGGRVRCGRGAGYLSWR